MSYATILIPSSGILDAYADNPDELSNALGIFLITWFIFTVLLMFGTIRRNIAFNVLLVFLALAFLLLACGEWSAKTTVTKAGGVFGLMAAIVAYYCAVSELIIREESYFMVPLGNIAKRED